MSSLEYLRGELQIDKARKRMGQDYEKCQRIADTQKRKWRDFMSRLGNENE